MFVNAINIDKTFKQEMFDFLSKVRTLRLEHNPSTHTICKVFKKKMSRMENGLLFLNAIKIVVWKLCFRLDCGISLCGCGYVKILKFFTFPYRVLYVPETLTNYTFFM